MDGGTMRTAYFLNDVEVSKPIMVKIGLHRCIINPTHEHLIEAGYEIREVEYEEVSYKPTYEERVVELIRLRYSPDQEYAILRQRDRKPEEFEEYDNYCEECKAIAKEEGV